MEILEILTELRKLYKKEERLLSLIEKNKAEIKLLTDQMNVKHA